MESTRNPANARVAQPALPADGARAMKLPPRFLKDENENTAAARTVPTRAEMPAADTWDLTALYPDVAAWQADLEALRDEYPRLLACKGRLGRSAADLLAALELEKALGLKIERLYSYASLQTSEDGSNADFLSREAQLENLLTRIGAATAFFEPESRPSTTPLSPASWPIPRWPRGKRAWRKPAASSRTSSPRPRNACSPSARRRWRVIARRSAS